MHKMKRRRPTILKLLAYNMALISFLVIVLLDPISRYIRSARPWEQIYRDDVIIIEMTMHAQNRHQSWNNGMDNGLEINVAKTHYNNSMLTKMKAESCRVN